MSGSRWWIAALASIAVLAATPSVASADYWELQTAGGTPYTGAVKLERTDGAWLNIGTDPVDATIGCASSRWSGQITDAGSGDGRPEGELVSAVWQDATGGYLCGSIGGLGYCTVQSLGGDWNMSVADDGDSVPRVRIADVEVTIQCVGGTCEYAAEEISGPLVAGTPATVDFAGEALSRTSGTGGCATMSPSLLFRNTFTAFSLTTGAGGALKAVSIPTPWELQTAAGAPYTGPLTLSRVGVVFTVGITPIESFMICGGTTQLTGEMTDAGPGAGGPAGELTLGVWSGGGPCGATVLGSCVLTPQGLPWEVSIADGASKEPRVSVDGFGVRLTCTAGGTCEYFADEISGVFTDGPPSKVTFVVDQTLTRASGTGLCATMSPTLALKSAAGDYTVTGTGGVNLKVVAP